MKKNSEQIAAVFRYGSSRESTHYHVLHDAIFRCFRSALTALRCTKELVGNSYAKRILRVLVFLKTIVAEMQHTAARRKLSRDRSGLGCVALIGCRAQSGRRLQRIDPLPLLPGRRAPPLELGQAAARVRRPALRICAGPSVCVEDVLRFRHVYHRRDGHRRALQRLYPFSVGT